MKTIPFGKVKLDLIEYASRANAILGIRDSGKTSTASYLAEQIHKGGVPFFAFDPSGAWTALRLPGDGPGLPVVIVGEKADIPLDPRTVPDILEAAMSEGVSMVFDMSGGGLSKADWRRIVKASVTTLLSKNLKHGLRHIYLEEAAEFVPQRPLDGETYAAIEKLVRIGGNHRLGVTLINQRSAELAKSVLELCDNLFLHRQRGKNSIENLSKWLDVGEVAEAKAITASLSSLPTGECWAWLGQDVNAVRVKVPKKSSAYVDRRVMRADLGKAGKAAAGVDVGAFVTAIISKLGNIKEAADANDPAKLRARIAELERKQGDPQDVATAYADGVKAGREMALGQIEGVLRHVDSVESGVEEIKRALDLQSDRFANLRKVVEAMKSDAGVRPVAPTDRLAVSRPPALIKRAEALKESRARPVNGASGALERPLQKIIDSIAWWNVFGVDEPTAPQAAFIAGYSHRSGTWSTYLSRLRSQGLIEARGLHLTDDGLLAAKTPPAVPTRGDLHRSVMAHIDGPLQRIMSPILAAYPQEQSAAQVAEAAGYSPASGTWSTYLSRLRSLDLIGKRGLRAQDWLFP